MKFRLITSIVLLIVILLLLPYAILALEPFGQGVFALVMFFIFFIVGYYIYGGLAKLAVYMIYFMLLLLGLFYLPDIYQVTVSLVATFIILVNPLQSLERKISKRLSKEFTNPIKISISGTYWPYVEYRKDMKEFYHLPQT
ncbi:MAG: hypothetical protein ACO3MF_03775, partial [Acholeplasmataceae bacterium]